MLDRIRNGTTTDADADTVQRLLDKSSSQSLRLMIVKWVLILFLIGGFLVGISIGGLFF